MIHVHTIHDPTTVTRTDYTKRKQAYHTSREII